jgi:hypothetical protein
MERHGGDMTNSLFLSEDKHATWYCTLFFATLLSNAFSIEYFMKLVMIGLSVNGNFKWMREETA